MQCLVYYMESILLSLQYYLNEILTKKFLTVGYRSLPLTNGYTEDLELASLLVHVELRNPKVAVYTNCICFAILCSVHTK